MTDLGGTDVRGAAPSFGTVLARLRTATLVPGRRISNGPASWHEQISLSQNALARRAGVSPGLITRFESGARHPQPESVLRLAAALELEDLDRARLLVAAGYWPWPELGPEDTALAIGVLLAVAEGDWRPLHGAERLDSLTGFTG